MISDKSELRKLKHIVKLYPCLEEQIVKSGDENILLVNDRVIQEIVIVGAGFVLNDDPLVNAECALIVWYDSEAFKADPIIVEFSFRYGDKKERYNRETAQKLMICSCWSSMKCDHG